MSITIFIVKEDFIYSGPSIGDFGGVYLILDDVRKTQVQETEQFPPEKYPWLSTVDPYGKTVFNQFQIPHVLAELEELKKDGAAQRFLADVEKVSSAVRQVGIELGSPDYLLLLGD